jgi:hypothetical protein
LWHEIVVQRGQVLIRVNHVINEKWMLLTRNGLIMLWLGMATQTEILSLNCLALECDVSVL